MTFREKLANEHPDCIDNGEFGECRGCPSSYGYEIEKRDCAFFTSPKRCNDCWNREIPEEPKEQRFRNCRNEIKDAVSTENLLCQLAEEAAELSKAALKLRRVLVPGNPTPVSLEEARDNLEEEAADVILCIQLLTDTYAEDYFIKHTGLSLILQEKARRWANRLEERDAESADKG